MFHYYIKITHPMNRNQPFYVGKLCQTGKRISESSIQAASVFTIPEIVGLFSSLVKQYGELSIITFLPCEIV